MQQCGDIWRVRAIKASHRATPAKLRVSTEFRKVGGKSYWYDVARSRSRTVAHRQFGILEASILPKKKRKHSAFVCEKTHWQMRSSCFLNSSADANQKCFFTNRKLKLYHDAMGILRLAPFLKERNKDLSAPGSRSYGQSCSIHHLRPPRTVQRLLSPLGSLWPSYVLPIGFLPAVDTPC